jgi:hypothetical protein
MLNIFVLLFSIAMAESALLERVVDVQSKEANPVSARSDMMNQASDKASEAVIKEIIGDAKFSRNKTLIQSKIIKNSARYIPFSKPGELKAIQPQGFSMKMVLKINVDSLQAMLLENGLFYETDSAPVVLPAIRWIDKVNSKNYAWWFDGLDPQKTFLMKEARNLEDNLKAALIKNNFYLLKPQNLHFYNFIPEVLRTESPRAEDWQWLSQKINSQVWIGGDVIFAKSDERSEAFKINLKWTAYQVLNGRVIAEVARNFETDSGSFEIVVNRKFKENVEQIAQDLSAQVFEAWQKGALGASLYKLTIKGSLPMLQQEAIKEVLKSKVREIKNVRERLITSEGVVFEVDSTLNPKELAQKIPKIELAKNLTAVLSSAEDTELTYRLQKGK